MNEEAKKWVLETLQQAKDVLLTEAPDVIHQMLGYAALQEGVGALCGLLMLGLGALTFWVSITKLTLDEHGEGKVLTLIGSSTMLGLGMVWFVSDTLDFTHVLFFPKSYLLHMVLG